MYRTMIHMIHWFHQKHIGTSNKSGVKKGVYGLIKMNRGKNEINRTLEVIE